MEYLLTYRFTWSGFLLYALLLIGFYLLLLQLEKWLPKINRLEPYRGQVGLYLHYARTGFEGVVLVVLGVVFILINPVYHGLLIILPLVAGFGQVRNYFTGLLIRLENLVRKGVGIRTAQAEGVIARMGRFGLHVQTPDGLHQVSYLRLAKEGYTLLPSEEVGGLYQLMLRVSNANTSKRSIDLEDLLGTVPYLDWSYRPVIQPVLGEEGAFKTTVLLKNDRHLQELLALIVEWGYSVQLEDRRMQQAVRFF